ncbi:MAG TPA: TatD family hydrolase [Candidatus Omnitrophota bacterium]|nr:TatD family hydrolase [Candidatus Omnitrophota bacterium]
MLQDIHIHIQDIKDPSVESEILSRSAQNGVGRMLCNGTSQLDWDHVASISSRCENVIPFFGAHPWMVKRLGEGWIEVLKSILLKTRSGIGEIGLDHGKFRPDRDLQLSVFRAQLDLASEFKRPVTLHCVGAWGALLDELKSRRMTDIPFMVHLFSGSADTLTTLLRMGAYLSFSLGIAEGGPEKVRLAFQATPIDRLVLETDYPYVPGKPKDEPYSAEEYFSRIKKIYSTAGAMRDMAPDEFERRVWENGSIFLRGIASR